MRWSAGEADGSSRDPSSPGSPRGTQSDPGTAPQASHRTSSGRTPAQTHRSPAGHRSPVPAALPSPAAPPTSAPAVLATPPTPASAVLARRPRASADAVATALALALLSAPEWSGERMLEAAQGMFGIRHRWLPGLVREVRAVYRTAPMDAPLELGAVTRSSAALAEALERAGASGRPLVIAHYPVAADSSPPQPPTGPDAASPALGRSRGPLPADALPSSAPRTLGALAALLEVTPGELDWLADVGAWNRRAPIGPLHHYRYEWRARVGRVPRLLEVPSERMRAAQRTLLHEVFALLPLHDAAHGFVPGRSAVTAARLHTGQEVVVTLDLVTFFARVTAGRVYGVLRQEGLPERVALALTGIATNRVPPGVLRAMPPGGDPDARFALRQALAAGHLPQGAPTSPALANLAIRRLDSRLTGYAEAADARYTRYADDLTFSGPLPLRRRADAFILGVTRIVHAEGHRVNRLKTRVRPAATSQRVTGIVVNERTALPRAEFDRLKAVIHNCAEHGPVSQNRDGHEDFRAHLLGRLSWARALNPVKAERLEREFGRIAW